MSLEFTNFVSLPAEAGCEMRERIVLLLPLLRNNNMATNIRRCTSCYGGRRFAECNYWTQTSCRTVAGKFSIGGLCVYLGGLDIIKLSKTPLIHSVSRFNLGGLELCLGGLSPPKPPRGDGTNFLAGNAASERVNGDSCKTSRFMPIVDELRLIFCVAHLDKSKNLKLT